MKILIIEDSSKVVYGGGQRITEAVIDIFHNANEIYLVDFSRESVVYGNNASRIKGFLALRSFGRISGCKPSNNVGFFETILFPFIFLSNLIPLLKWYKKTGRPGLIYCATKKAFIYGAFLKAVYGGRLVFHCHYVTSASLLSRVFDRAVCGWSDEVICVSKYVTGQFPRRDSLRVVYNCADMPGQGPARTRTDAPLRIGFVGNLIPLKGVDVFFRVAGEAVASGEPYEFHVFGKNLTGVKIPASVAYRGFVPREEIYGSIDVLLVCSKVPESFSLSSAEAQACGVPVIAPRLGAFAEVIDDGSSGLLYGSYDEIKTHLKRLSDKETYERFSGNARAKAMAFNCEDFASGMKKAFKAADAARI